MTSSTASINKNRPVPIFLELAFCYFLTWFSLIPKLVVFHPFLNLLIGHVEVAFLFVQRGHLRHLVLSQFEVEYLDILLNMLRIRRAGYHAEALLSAHGDRNDVHPNYSRTAAVPLQSHPSAACSHRSFRVILLVPSAYPPDRNHVAY